MNNFTKRCVAAFASLAMAGTLCAAGAVTVSSVAWGVDQTQGGKTEKAPWELGAEASTKTGSITIYKWKDEVEKGKQKKSTPVSGAEFTVKKATNIDLTKYSDWVKIANKISDFNDGKENPGGITFEGNGTTKNTSGTDQGAQKGVAKFDNLGIGLYQVTESKVPDGFSAAESKPFYMTIPMIEKGDGDKVAYNYNPSANPKNKDLSDSVKKTADTSKTVGAGDKISYTISAELDKMKETGADATALTADDFKGYSVVDLAPDKSFTTYDASVVTRVTVGTDDTNKSNTELKNEGSTKYYEVGTVTDVAAVTSGNNQDVARKKIPITFTEEGKKALATAANNNAGKVVKVFVTLEFTLAGSDVLGNSTVANKGGLIPSHTTGNPDVVTGKKYKEVKFSKFTIQKLSAKDKSKVTGAKFKLFADKTNADNCSKAISENKTGNDLTTACSAASTNFGEKEAKGTDAKTDEYSVVRGKKYYVVETVAPAGYIRNPDAVEVKVEDTDATKNFEFQDVPDDSQHAWFNLLPKTGAAGVILFALAGACFVGAGFVVYIHRRKKEEEQAKLRA